MNEYTEVTETIEVPKNAGLEGFLLALKGILKKPRVQAINIDAYGKVKYTYYQRVGEDPEVIRIAFDDLQPYAIIRNGKVEELPSVPESAPIALSLLFDWATREQLYPLAFVLSPQSHFWRWYTETTGITPQAGSMHTLYGLPFLWDRMVEEHVLILCAGYERAGAMVDTRKSYKLVIPPPRKVTP
jgi:hypothetical protein